jgi:molybdate transport system ATP-binding protein
MIEVRNAHKSLGAFSLNGVDLRIESGEYFVVLGPTGAGKTVLLECIAGLHRLDQGEVWLDGREVTHELPEQRNIGYVPQDYVLFPHVALRENIGFSLSLRKVPPEQIEARVLELADLFHIGHLLDRRPGTLSGGEQQRGALARALAPRPTVLLLDEPLSALDEGTRAELIPELRRVSRDTGTTVIHVCHNFDETLQLAHRLAILRQGLLLQTGSPTEVFRRPATAFVARFVGGENLFEVGSLDRDTRTIVIGEGVKLAVERLPDGDKLLAMIRPEDIALRPGEVADAALDEVALQVERVEDRGRLMHLHLRGRLPLLVTLTRQAYRATAVSPGEHVLAHCRPEVIHVIAN